MWRSALILIVLSAAASLSSPAGAQAADQAHIKHLRVGRHAHYDRLVLQLDRLVEVAWGTNEDPHSPVFEIAARPLHPQVLETGLSRLGTVRVESTPQGARLRTDSRPRRVRVFRLSKPPRIVIDFADAKPEAFAAPKGTDAIVAESNPMLRGVSPKPVPEPAPAPTAQVKPKAKAPVPVAKTEPKTDAPRSPFSPPTSELIERSLQTERSASAKPIPEAPKAKTVKKALPKPAAKPKPTAQTKPTTKPKSDATTEPRTARAPEPRAEMPAPAEADAPRDLTALWIGLGALSLVGAFVLLGSVLRRSRATVYDEDGNPIDGDDFSPETITSEELYRDGTRVEILDKRLDEEVRARMQLEERILHANEEIKVLRDRLARLERRRGA